MPEKRMKVAILNVKVHPHPSGAYVTLLQRAKRKRVIAKMRADRYGMIGTFSKSPLRDGAFSGSLLTFVNFDPSAPWADIETGEAAEADDIAAIEVPPHLKPGLRLVPFVFFPDRHRFVFPLNPTTSITSVASLLTNILREAVRQEDGDATVNVVPEQDIAALDKILQMPELRSLTITLSRPNGDDLSELNDEIEEFLDEQNAEELTQKYRAIHGSSLTPNKRTKLLAQLATSNGVVVGHGLGTDGRAETISTDALPLTMRDVFKAGEEQDHVLMRIGLKLLRKVGAKLKA